SCLVRSASWPDPAASGWDSVLPMHLAKHPHAGWFYCWVRGTHELYGARKQLDPNDKQAGRGEPGDVAGQGPASDLQSASGEDARNDQSGHSKGLPNVKSDRDRPELGGCAGERE